jgi:hypothetical protein
MAYEVKTLSRWILGSVDPDTSSGMGGVGVFPSGKSDPGFPDNQDNVQLSWGLAIEYEPQLPLLLDLGPKPRNIRPGSY